VKTLLLHDSLNPARIVPMDPADFSIAVPCITGSLVYTKGNDQPVMVHETPEDIAIMLRPDAE
jgi:hypothetical protein